MRQVITTVSSTHCCTNLKQPQQAGTTPLLWSRRRCLLLGLSCCAAHSLAQAADEGAGQLSLALPDVLATPEALPIEGLHLQREGGQLLLSSTLTWALPEAVADALRSGVPVYFVVQAQLQRKRWWWRDETIAEAQRYLRLSYQPLTRRWRVHQGTSPLGSSNLGVGTSYTEMHEALSVIQRLVRWRIGDAAALPREGELWLQLLVRLDLSQFPRPLQIGAMGRSDWNQLAEQTQRVLAETL